MKKVPLKLYEIRNEVFCNEGICNEVFFLLNMHPLGFSTVLSKHANTLTILMMDSVKDILVHFTTAFLKEHIW